MTVFPNGTKESLHGHNYTTEVTLVLKDISFKKMIPFNEIKVLIKEICEAWDEKVLLPKKCPFFKLKTLGKHEVDFFLCQSHYVLPKDEVVLLDLDNISTETLAQAACSKLVSKLASRTSLNLVEQIKFRIEESPGQGASCIWKLQ
jgi:6-pyruvoyltetrahydropterin/6-carboxytetrahydropterin synthase